jgi:hypothetical protein
LGNETDEIVEATPVLKLMGGKKAYERFVLAGMGEEHNEAYYAVEDQRFLGEEGFGEEISRDVEEISKPKRKKPIETVFKEIARRVKASPELIRSKDRRWDISHKRAEAVAILMRQCGYGVSEVATYLGRDQANVSTMLSRLSARQTGRTIVMTVMPDPSDDHPLMTTDDSEPEPAPCSTAVCRSGQQPVVAKGLAR